MAQASPHLPVLTHRSLVTLAFPIMLANIAVPLLGIVDTAVIGQSGQAHLLGAIAIGSMVFNFLFWAFGFLRMSTSGFIAQASGSGDEIAINFILLRALIAGCSIGILLVIAQQPLLFLALKLLSPSDTVSSSLRAFFEIRILGAPATLANYAVVGCLIGLLRMRSLLVFQLILNGLNLILDVWFVWGLSLGIEGIAYGTVIAEWTSLLLALGYLVHIRRRRAEKLTHNEFLQRLFCAMAWLSLFKTNTDLFWRTLFMLLGFSYFVKQGAQFGDDVLAANHLLLQFISFSAFCLDAFANVVESLAGRAYGAGNRTYFNQLVRRSTTLAMLTALLLAGILWLFNEPLLALLSSNNNVNEIAQSFMVLAAVYIVCSFVAFQLDGLFIGLGESRAMRNASFASLGIFAGLAWMLVEPLANTGLWLAFIGYVIARAIFLSAYLPRLYRQFPSI